MKGRKGDFEPFDFAPQVENITAHRVFETVDTTFYGLVSMHLLHAFSWYCYGSLSS